MLHLVAVLRLPDQFSCKNGTIASSVEGLCVLLRRMAYPNRLTDMIAMFGRSKSELSMIFNNVVNFVFAQHHSLLNNLNLPWLAPEKLLEMARAVHQKGAALDNSSVCTAGTSNLTRITATSAFSPKSTGNLNF